MSQKKTQWLLRHKMVIVIIITSKVIIREREREKCYLSVSIWDIWPARLPSAQLTLSIQMAWFSSSLFWSLPGGRERGISSLWIYIGHIVTYYCMSKYVLLTRLKLVCQRMAKVHALGTKWGQVLSCHHPDHPDHYHHDPDRHHYNPHWNLTCSPFFRLSWFSPPACIANG